MTYTREEVETACCVWEAMVDMRTKLPALEEAFLQHGFAAMRNVAIDLAKPIEVIWHGMTDEQRDEAGSFDWEFCPDLLHDVDWAQWPPVIREKLL